MPRHIGRFQVFNRPKGFFRDKGTVPVQASLKLEPVPAYSHLELHEYIEHLAQEIDDREAELSARRRATGQRVLGRRMILRQSHLDRPSAPEPRRRINPRVACRNKWARIEALQRLRSFIDAYRDAWRRWRAGDPDVLFPYGTYALRVQSGVRCCGPP